MRQDDLHQGCTPRPALPRPQKFLTLPRPAPKILIECSGARFGANVPTSPKGFVNQKFLVHLGQQMSLFAEKSWQKEKHILSGLGHQPPPYLEHSPKKTFLKVPP